MTVRQSTGDYRKVNITPIFKKCHKEDPGNNWLDSFTSMPSKAMQQILQEVMLEYIEDRKVIRDSQQGVIKGRWCLSNLILLLKGVTTSGGKGRTIDEGKSSTLISVRPLAWTPTAFLPLSYRDMSLTDGLLDEELTAWVQPKDLQ